MTFAPRTAQIGLLAAALLVLTGCARHDHAAMHAMHHGGMMTSAAPTAPVSMTQSTPTLGSGYKKVAAAPEAKVYFANLRNGATVTSPVKVVFGLSGMGVAPAGVEKPAPATTTC